MGNKLTIKNTTKDLLNNFRHKILGSFTARNNDLNLLLNLGFSEKAFFDSLSGIVELKKVEVEFNDKSREFLLKLLKVK